MSIKPNAEDTQLHRDQYINVLDAQVERVSGPLNRRQKDELSIWDKWLAMASVYQLAEEEENVPRERK